MNTFIELLFFILPLILCQARVINSPRQARLSLAESAVNYYYYTNYARPGSSGTYSFGYDVSDTPGGDQYRDEERYPNGTVVGSYGYVDPTGRAHKYRYIADHRGYRVMRDYPVLPKPIQPPVEDLEPITWTRRPKPKYPKKKTDDFKKYTVENNPNLHIIRRF